MNSHPSLSAINEARPIIDATDTLVVCSHSGGKDSQAMTALVAELVPAARILVVHAALGDVEWPGALELARDHAATIGAAFRVATARRTLLQMVEERFVKRPEVPSWPSAATRQCTSDLKRGPIERETRGFAREGTFRSIVMAMGMRAAESSSRAKQVPWKHDGGKSTRLRPWHNWLPIHGLTTSEVFAIIAAAGMQPHPAYAAGNERLSCMFCIMGSANDARNAAVHNPELYARYVEIEKRTGYTSHMGRKSLVSITGLTVAVAHAQRKALPIYQGIAR